MLTSFFVSNFRLFRRLELSQLGRVNLIVGKNSSGKTALLEAVRLYASNGDLDVLVGLLTSRHEFWKQMPPRNIVTPPSEAAVRHLFYGHKLPEIGEEGIRIGVSDSRKSQLRLTIAAYRMEHKEGEIRQTRIDFPALSDDLSDIQRALVVEDADAVLNKIDLLEYTHERFRAYRHRGIPNNRRCPMQIVSTQVIGTSELASLWDSTSLTDLEHEVIAGLKLLEPGITGLAFVEDEENNRNNTRIPIVKRRDYPEPLPLKTQGEGIFRLFHIVLALVNARDGILLVDEFENGLHWSVLPKVWDVVFRLSEKLNVQVFATTHSSDCVRGFESAWKEHIDAGAFFRLDAKDGDVKATAYDCETLSDALEMDVEVR